MKLFVVVTGSIKGSVEGVMQYLSVTMRANISSHIMSIVQLYLTLLDLFTLFIKVLLKYLRKLLFG